jgi:hypothetical protein
MITGYMFVNTENGRTMHVVASGGKKRVPKGFC